VTRTPASFAWWAFDPVLLAKQKEEQGLTVSVCLPARDEAGTVGDIVAAIHRQLVVGVPLVDELIVVDDGSTDATGPAALAAGAEVIPVDTILPEEGPGAGKGNVIWRSLAASEGDLVCWIDADIRNFEPHFVTGLLGPLLDNPSLAFVKGHYRRPLDGQPTGGGRVSELVARPLLSRFFPELAGFAQPLAGEYAGRRSLLESVPMVEGWGVEIALLVDVWRAVGIHGLGQVDLGVREHRNRPLDELALPASAVLATVLQRAGIDLPGPGGTPELLRFAGEAGVEGVAVPFAERPPMRSRPGYRLGRRAATGSPDPAGPGGRGDLDGERIARAVRELLAAIGEDPDREGLVRTPERVAAMYAELCGGLHEDPAAHLDTRFDAGHDELILVRDIPFASLCEHHLMPFSGRAHVGYIPGLDGRITGLSKLARLVDGFARRPQVQERLTTQIADAMQDRLGPRGVVVVIEAEHQCLSMRGVRKPGATTVTSAVRGVLRDDAAARAEALSMLHGSARP
jgi:GTP cyclohydrolase I